MNKLPLLILPKSLNYVAAFLTMECNLACNYCINKIDRDADRKAIYQSNCNTISPSDWVKVLNRIPKQDGLPISLQGGEPMLYHKAKGIGMILKEVDHYFDLLTNFAIHPSKFIESLHGMEHKMMRDCSTGTQAIRVSYHPAEHQRAWANGFLELVARCEALRDFGFLVSKEKDKSHLVIVMVEHPDNKLPDQARFANVLIEKKPFLGTHEGKLYGNYLYPDATCAETTKTCECRTTELLIDPLGDVWQCHYHLYNKWTGGDSKPVGNMLDPSFSMDALTEFRTCDSYGKCIGCDVKIKNDRNQSLLHEGKPHTSVEIINIR